MKIPYSPTSQRMAGAASRSVARAENNRLARLIRDRSVQGLALPRARQAFDPGARFRRFPLGHWVIGGLAASTPDGIWLGTYEHGPGRLFRFTAATLARLSDGETLEASQAATVLSIPDHAQGAAIGGGVRSPGQ